MSLLVDTSVWSLALRRDQPPNVPEIRALRDALTGGDQVSTSGIILQELLQGVVPPSVRAQIMSTFRALHYIAPSMDDHVAAAHLRTVLRSKCVQVGTIDALIAHIAIDRQHTLLTTDKDFEHAAKHVGLQLWRPPADGGDRSDEDV